MSRYYPEELIDSMVRKMTLPPARSATSLAKEVGIPQGTLSRWVRSRATVKAQGDGTMQRRPQQWGAEEKLTALLEYERLAESERGSFLRSKGLHEADLQEWKKECIEGLKTKPPVSGRNDPQRKRIAALEKELKRKEAALAEAAALLVLKKKADAIWGDPRDEK